MFIKNIVAITGSNWKAQTFYIAPIKDVGCVIEQDTSTKEELQKIVKLRQ